MPFKIIRNDITKIKADAIVNTANPKPVVGGGTDAAIYAAAGPDALLAERKKIGNITRGDIAVTPAFALSAKYIIHTVGPACLPAQTWLLTPMTRGTSSLFNALNADSMI
ncbi:MAG: macro domain-containing protein [Lachnospiraceae bacterium]|nr:macro domain-containing protein [Lachnospiraceae bacterium]